MDDTPTAISLVFSESMLKLFELDKCITDNGKYIDMTSIRRRLNEGVFDVELFN